MLLEIEGGPSDEYEQNNADWASLVTATIQAAQERDRAEKLWQSGRRSEAMAILHKNPNVGIEYRALVNGEVVDSGSYFGQAAADFLNGINIAVGAGLLSPATPQNPKIDVDDLRAGIEEILSDSRGRCGAFISSLIAGTATENNPVESTDILKLFNDVAKQGKFVYGDTIKQSYGLPGATIRGSISKGTAQVELPTPWSNFNPTNNKDIAASTRRITLFSVIHELIHLSGKNGYNDSQLHATVAAMKGLAPPTYPGMTSKQGILSASINWTSSMEIACKSRKK
jgi:hypothetical protein